MADTQQGVRHQSARDAAGTTDTYDGDLRALFEAVATVPAGSTFNEAFMLWLQSVTGSSADNINDLAALFASQQGDTYNWSSVGPLLLFRWQVERAAALPSTASFTPSTLPALVETTSDGQTIWFQQTKLGELAILNGHNRDENLLDTGTIDDLTPQNGVTVDGDEVTFPGVGVLESLVVTIGIDSNLVPFPAGTTRCFAVKIKSKSGPATLQIRESGGSETDSVEINIDATSRVYGLVTKDTTTSFSNFIIDNNATGGPFNVVFEAIQFGVYLLQEEDDAPPSFVNPQIVYNAIVSGVRYQAQTNANLIGVEGPGVVTIAPGAGLTGAGFVSEPDVENLNIQSSDYNTAWTLGTTTTATDIGVSDIGLRTHILNAGTGTGIHRMFLTEGTIGEQRSAFIIARAITGRYLTQRLGGSGVDDFVSFDFVDGIAIESGSNIEVTRMKPLRNGFYKAEITLTTGGGFHVVSISDSGQPGTGDPSFTGSNETFEIAHCQVEVGDTCHSPVVTAGTAVTRPADALKCVTLPADLGYGGFFDVTYPNPIGPTSEDDSPMLQFGEVNPNDRLTIYGPPAGVTRQLFTTAGLNISFVTPSLVDKREQLAARIEENNSAFVVTDETVAEDLTTSPIRTGDLTLGEADDNYFVGKIHDVRVYSSPPSNEELQDVVTPTYSIFLLAGQSNLLAGETIEANDKIPFDRILQWGRNGSDDGKVIRAIEPLQHPSQQLVAIGFAFWFAQSYRSRFPDKRILLVPCGENDAGFLNDRWGTGDPRFDDAVSRCNDIISQYPSSSLEAIFWQGGEHDAGLGLSTAAYAGLLDDMVNNMRLQITGAANTPLVLGEMSQSWVDINSSQRQPVQTALQQTPGRLANSLLVLSGGLATHDGLHFDAASQRSLGQLYFNGFITL